MCRGRIESHRRAQRCRDCMMSRNLGRIGKRHLVGVRVESRNQEDLAYVSRHTGYGGDCLLLAVAVNCE